MVEEIWPFYISDKRRKFLIIPQNAEYVWNKWDFQELKFELVHNLSLRAGRTRLTNFLVFCNNINT